MSKRESKRWHEAINATIHRIEGPFDRVSVFEDVGSTQDALRAMDAPAGCIVCALRQRAGRGRRGRTWSDSSRHGVALSFALATDDARFVMLSSTCATRACIAQHAPVGHMPRIKWPNDIILARRKVAGVLTEARAGLVFVGIGINVLQRDWPSELAGRAISLVEAGTTSIEDRLPVVTSLIEALSQHLREPISRHVDVLRSYDALSGARVRLRYDDNAYVGQISSFDPLGDIEVVDEDGLPRRLPASQVTIEAATGPHIALPS